MGAGRREFLYSMADLPPTLLVIVREKTGARQVPQNARVPHLCLSTGLLARKSLCLLFGNYSEPSYSREFSRSPINRPHIALSERPVRRPEPRPAAARYRTTTPDARCDNQS